MGGIYVLTMQSEFKNVQSEWVPVKVSSNGGLPNGQVKVLLSVTCLVSDHSPLCLFFGFLVVVMKHCG